MDSETAKRLIQARLMDKLTMITCARPDWRNARKKRDFARKKRLSAKVTMPKRKRENNESPKDALRKQFELGQTLLVRNLKVARGIERQKLGRRQKDALAKKDAADNVRIEAEIRALKVCLSLLW
jgi:Zn-dependent M32 family carboxypeptidase